MYLRPSLARSNRVRHSLESLESREVLSATVTQLGNGTLVISGTDAPDRIQINDDGTRVSVYADSAYKGTYANVPGIVVFARGGNDQVVYDAQGDVVFPNGFVRSVPIRRNLFADLGTGNDLFQANVVRTLTPPNVLTAISSLGLNSNLNMQVMGGDGSDEVDFRANTIDAGSSLSFVSNGGAGNDYYSAVYGVPVAAQQANTVTRFSFFGDIGDDQGVVSIIGSLPSNAQTYVDLEGQAGNDALYTLYQNGIMNGYVQLKMFGGTGNDILSTDFEMRTFSNLGTVDAYLYGGDGNDYLYAVFHKQRPADTTRVNAFAIGEAGFDTIRYTPGVAVSGEVLIPVA